MIFLWSEGVSFTIAPVLPFRLLLLSEDEEEATLEEAAAEEEEAAATEAIARISAQLLTAREVGVVALFLHF